MTMQLRTSININADKETIWNILTDFEHYPSWNPFITSISGEQKEGGRLKANIKGMTFKPTVLSYEKQKEFKWLGHLLIKGLFDGEHRFHLSENKDGSIRFEQSEKFSGILVRFFKSNLESKTKIGFEEMNKAIKLRAESQYLR